MATVHITEAELAHDVYAVLEKVRQGIDVVIERDRLPFAVVRATQFRGRPIDECIAIASAAGLQVTLDDDFSKDLEEIIESHREPLSLIERFGQLRSRINMTETYKGYTIRVEPEPTERGQWTTHFALTRLDSGDVAQERPYVRENVAATEELAYTLAFSAAYKHIDIGAAEQDFAGQNAPGE